MVYHPIIGIIIFLIAIVLSFFLGRFFIKYKNTNLTIKNKLNKELLPKGEITSPDAPWLKKK
ncbi:hypothetical protein N9T15_00835 [Pelagibacteraceae bacterium]|nr:hypothetical protein [Pelagibacteraceae bacterium]